MAGTTNPGNLSPQGRRSVSQPANVGAVPYLLVVSTVRHLTPKPPKEPTTVPAQFRKHPLTLTLSRLAAFLFH